MEQGHAARPANVPAVLVPLVRARRAEAPALAAAVRVRAVGRTSPALSGVGD